MADIFGSVVWGTLAASSVDSGVSSGSVAVRGLNPNTCLLQRVGTGQSVNLQLTPTLGQSVFSYAMGDRPGTVTISGKAFSELCSGSGDGFREVLTFYKQQRSKDAPTLVDVVVDEQALRGYLVSVDVYKDDPVMRSSSFTLMLSTTPSHMGL